MKLTQRILVFLFWAFLISACGNRNAANNQGGYFSLEPTPVDSSLMEEEEPDPPSGPCLTVVSWNIANLGKSKDDDEIAFMADMVDEGDIVVIQEVVAGNGGAQAVARLADALNRRGAKWDYVVSNPT